MGDMAPGTEYQSREDRAAGRSVRQRIGELTGKRQWKGTMTDPDEGNAKCASFEVTFLADVQPAPTTTEVLPGIRPVELDGLTAEPRSAGNGEFTYQPYAFRATWFAAAGASSGGGRSAQPARTAGGESASKAA